MLLIDNVVVHPEVTSAFFVCNLAACKGACCVEGEGGAPLTAEEAHLLDTHLPQIAPYMDATGLATAQQKGTHYMDDDSDLATQLVGGRECVFAHYDPLGVLKCAVEDAHRAGAIPFEKPISCHLYPIRVVERGQFDHLLYHQWDICSPACANGTALGVRVHEFLKDALVRRYGTEWYAALCAAVDRA